MITATAQQNVLVLAEGSKLQVRHVSNSKQLSSESRMNERGGNSSLNVGTVRCLGPEVCDTP